MQFNITTTTKREIAIEAFRRTNMRARAGQSIKRIFSAVDPTLIEFGKRAARLSPIRGPHGVQDIPVERIVGSLGRARDFDSRFRPLKKHLRDRWVRVYLDLDEDRWDPIRVHKLGDE